MKVTLNKGGSKERQVEINEIQIPDLWKVAQIKELNGYSLGETPVRDMIVECWHLAHDLKRELADLQAKHALVQELRAHGS